MPSLYAGRILALMLSVRLSHCVLTLTLMNCERAMELISLPHVEVMRVFSRVAMELVKSAVLRSRNAALRPLRKFTAQGTACAAAQR